MKTYLALSLVLATPGCIVIGPFFRTECGNGLIEENADIPESCDDGNTTDGDGCDSNCQSESFCGDGFITANEACDDGNINSGDGCRGDCAGVELCGDGLIDIGETCDDGNDVNEDGCNAVCLLEGDLCGNNILEAGEACDDGNTTDGDGCDATCQSENPCGNGIVEGIEECDDANNINDDGCSSLCVLEFCGDGVVNPFVEECDDGNPVNGDGCDAACQIENSFCGNGLVDAGEECDDANQNNTDSCVSNCSFPDIVQVTAGSSHACALTEFGGVKCWGDAITGQLGYGNINDIGDDEQPFFVGFVSLGFSADSLDAGGVHNCALGDGELLCWGDGASGQLGQGNTFDIGDNESPANSGSINFGANNIVQVSAGGSHTCAVFDNNAVQCWGDGFFGQLGYGNSNDIGDNEPPFGQGAVDLGTSSQEVAQVTAGDSHTCVLLSSGSVRCWGRANNGQLGYGTPLNIGDDAGEIQQIPDVSIQEAVISIAANGDTTCALLNNGNIRCWGLNSSGQLGLGNTANIGDNETPSSVSALSFGQSFVVQVAVGFDHTCALFDNSTALCWGNNAAGQLGQGNSDNLGDNESISTVSPINIGNAVSQITAGDSFTCALLLSGAVRCWGDGADGRLGYGNITTIGDNEFPATAGDVPLF